MIVGYTAGIFDLFHIGHLNLLKNCKKYCDYLIVNVMSDEYSLLVKQKLPIINEYARHQIVQSIKYVDRCEIDTRGNILANMSEYCPNIVFKGSDWENTPKWNNLITMLKHRNIEVKFFPYTESISSSKLIETIRST